MEQSFILNELKQMARWNVDPKQKAWFKRRLKDARPVSVLPMKDVLCDKDLDSCEYLEFKKRQCYRNATILVQWLNSCLEYPSVKYVEGLVLNPELGFSIEHAWVKVGDVYIDPTFEKCLEKDVTKCEYVVLGEWEESEFWPILEKNKVYGDIYREMYIRSLNQ